MITRDSASVSMSLSSWLRKADPGPAGSTSRDAVAAIDAAAANPDGITRAHELRPHLFRAEVAPGIHVAIVAGRSRAARAVASMNVSRLLGLHVVPHTRAIVLPKQIKFRAEVEHGYLQHWVGDPHDGYSGTHPYFDELDKTDEDFQAIAAHHLVTGELDGHRENVALGPPHARKYMSIDHEDTFGSYHPGTFTDEGLLHPKIKPLSLASLFGRHAQAPGFAIRGNDILPSIRHMLESAKPHQFMSAVRVPGLENSNAHGARAWAFARALAAHPRWPSPNDYKDFIANARQFASSVPYVWDALRSPWR